VETNERRSSSQLAIDSILNEAMMLFLFLFLFCSGLFCIYLFASIHASMQAGKCFQAFLFCLRLRLVLEYINCPRGHEFPVKLKAH
jgi:hypothetical protein